MYFKGVGEKGLAYYKTGKPEDHEKLLTIFFDDCPKAAKAFTEAINKIKEFHEKNGQGYVSESKDAASKTNQVSLMVTIIGALVGLSIGYMFAHATSKSITSVADDLARTTSHVTETSTEMAQASDKLAQSTTEQSASLAETSASLEELTAMVAKNSDNASHTSKASETTQQKANDGKKAVERMLHSMGEINQSNIMIKDQINNSNAQLNEIVQVIQEIGNKTKVINDIVFQTKLLSFNASVEAARAGEHGKGFAVVAEEVGSLAQMSGNAAKEISDMLDSSISKVESIVKDTKTQVEILISQGNEKVQDGIQVAEECSAFLNEIVTNISTVSSMSSEISNASQEQTIGISEINKAVSQLDIVTQENSTTSQMAASSAEHLSSQARELKAAVQVLLETAYGKKINLANTNNSGSAENESSQDSHTVFSNQNIDLKKRAG